MRLQSVQKRRLSHELMHSIESAKIQLSKQFNIELPLTFIEKTLAFKLQREEVKVSMTKWFDKMYAMIDEAIAEVDKQPEVIYLTGGMGLSPLVLEAINHHYPSTKVEVADAFSSVVFGALLTAKKLYS